MRGLKVLSLFDGISCGMVALERASIPVEMYYASEIDEYAMKISQKNYPNIIQLGDITKLTQEQLLNLPVIDLLIGGSPCQSLSSSNVWLKDGEYGINGTGKSNLFWEYVRVLKILQSKNPNIIFLLENVGSANTKDRNIIDEILGVKGIKFNSNLLTAQNRNRIYWSNIFFNVPSERKQLFMKDILEDIVGDKYYITQKMYDCIMSPATKGWQSGNMEINLKIARPLTATMHKMHRADTDNYISTSYKPSGKTNVRRLTPIECERLQTLPDNYTDCVSDTRRYQSIGNEWTVDIIAHIFSGLKD